ncbi:hypothetical protein WDW86_14290 [Bdellovibrionota bacterium FG-2]
MPSCNSNIRHIGVCIASCVATCLFVMLAGCTEKAPPERNIVLFPVASPVAVDLTKTENTPLQLKESAPELAAEDVGGDFAVLRFSLLENADNLKMECSARGGEFVGAKLSMLSKEARTMKITGLKSGTSYLCALRAGDATGDTKAQFKIIGSVVRKPSDGPMLSEMIQFQTVPEIKERYQGVIAVTAFGAASEAPEGTPVLAQVSVTWQPFLKADQKTVYRLIRVSRGGTLDMATKQVCTPDEKDSCMVCRQVGAGAKSCADTAVATAPAQYYYSVGLELDNWPEELPRGSSEKYLVSVPIPPANMVLVQRDAANAEMCALLGRKSDPLAHQRCPYKGLGSVPVNSSPGKLDLNLDPKFYDLGYSFFVDRWSTGCRWSPKTDSVLGRCGKDGEPGDCFGPVLNLTQEQIKDCGPLEGKSSSLSAADCLKNSTPPDSMGVEGSVFYSTHSVGLDFSRGGECFIKSAGKWKSANSPDLSSMERSSMATQEPSQTTRRPPLVQVDQHKAALQCEAQNDSFYGPKRLMRRREYVIAAAWPHLDGEQGQMSDEQINILEDGKNHGATHACNSNKHEGVLVSAAFNSSHEVARGAEEGPDSFVIGSLATSKCVSRFGAQDMVGNTYSWVSDQLGDCSAAKHSCRGVLSSLDSGNSDWVGFMFDGLQGPGGESTELWSIEDKKYGAMNFSYPLGVPLVGTDGGEALPISGNEARFHGDLFALYTDQASVWGDRELYGSTRGGMVGGASFWGTSAGRFGFHLGFSPVSTYVSVGFRCVLPVE